MGFCGVIRPGVNYTPKSQEPAPAPDAKRPDDGDGDGAPPRGPKAPPSKQQAAAADKKFGRKKAVEPAETATATPAYADDDAEIAETAAAFPAADDDDGASPALNFEQLLTAEGTASAATLRKKKQKEARKAKQAAYADATADAAAADGRGLHSFSSESST
jgi:hypothetical protein